MKAIAKWILNIMFVHFLLSAGMPMLYLLVWRAGECKTMDEFMYKIGYRYPIERENNV